MIAHIMITNVNKSVYVTILPPSYIKTRRSRRNRPPAAWVNILYFQCTVDHLARSDLKIVVGLKSQPVEPVLFCSG